MIVTTRSRRALAVVAFILIPATTLLALEPPDKRRVTEEDTLYFVTKLDKEQVERIAKIINHSYLHDKKSCDKYHTMKSTQSFIKEMLPIFKEASKSDIISSYARKYSKELVSELSATTTALNELLPGYASRCRDEKR